MWLDDIEPLALEQAHAAANIYGAFKWVALMPDCHQGYGVPIGSVLATREVVIPNAVGVDIGCGMCAVRSNLSNVAPDAIGSIVAGIKKIVPTGFSHHAEKQSWEGFDNAPDSAIVQSQLESAHYQLGTLGGGNHFIELQRDARGTLWIMLHSGSRNIGLQIARHFHNKAVALCQKWQSAIAHPDLCFLPLDTPEAEQYLLAMQFALEFARENRFHMLNAVQQVIREIVPDASFDQPINIHHNYVARETHFSQQVFVHRKGATSAQSGQMGIIPGSQGATSYIVRGKGNPESFMSCSHGAGRKMGRRQAQRQLSLQTEQKRLVQMGVVHAVESVRNLDEAPGAYKDIQQVMRNQSDLVEIVEELHPLGVVKG